MNATKTFKTLCAITTVCISANYACDCIEDIRKYELKNSEPDDVSIGAGIGILAVTSVALTVRFVMKVCKLIIKR